MFARWCGFIFLPRHGNPPPSVWRSRAYLSSALIYLKQLLPTLSHAFFPQSKVNGRKRETNNTGNNDMWIELGSKQCSSWPFQFSIPEIMSAIRASDHSSQKEKKARKQLSIRSFSWPSYGKATTFRKSITLGGAGGFRNSSEDKGRGTEKGARETVEGV